ncbi:RNA polymerase sigma factor [Cesiribacter andamanensis]|uniref:Sigma-24 n=1 Tax=Cesiribacter andamanensis AMV16 TaxID=1279009 RepID=M7N345_9BACT|nr:sigma-70 family RNA polymerase sigma factor [Cesiribacter andamanensis]EMR01646.1 Sigma-24 [Cesiribacter andamanensis AMV16]
MYSDKEIVEGCRRNDLKMQQALYDRFAGRMFVVCLRYASGQLEAEDILQEAFIKVYRKIDTYREESSLAHWLKRVVVNTALNHQRSRLYMYPMVDVESLHDLSDQESILSDYTFQELLELIRELPAGCRVIFNLFAIEGYGHKEIAELLGISEGTSKSQYARARKLLQEQLAETEKRVYGRRIR